MAIPLNRYVSINSGVGAGAVFTTRQLGGRFFTENPLVPTDGFVQFSSAADVATYFGSDSVEYSRALFYFGWISKSNTSPSKMSFARWANVAVGSAIYGKVATYAVSQFTGVTTGDFTLTLGGFTHHLTAINLSSAASLSDVAADIQTVIRAFSGGGAAWTSATVTYDATRKSFNLVSGTTGTDTITILAGATTDVARLLGWLTGAILSNGTAAQTITDVLDSSVNLSNNFGSFAFVPTLTLDQVTEAAQWNLAQNNMFMYCIPVSAANASSWSTALSATGGVNPNLAPLSTEYPEQDPMMMLDATDYSQPNSVLNYMFNTFNQTPSVTTSADADIYDGLGINYYGQTQQAGQLRSFYQRGTMWGLQTDPTSANVYANEIWLKDAIGVVIMNLFLALNQVAANSAGRSQLLSIIQGPVNQALLNGTISVGKPLTDIQKAFITQKTNSPTAWQQVQNTGYWLDAEIIPDPDHAGEYIGEYTLLYSKDDVIRFVKGTDSLI